MTTPGNIGAAEKLAELMEAPTWSGESLAKGIRAEGFDAEQAAAALLSQGFTVHKQTMNSGVVLHVSRKPLSRRKPKSSLLRAFGPSSEPQLEFVVSSSSLLQVFGPSTEELVEVWWHNTEP